MLLPRRNLMELQIELYKYFITLLDSPRQMPELYVEGLRFRIETLTMSDPLNNVVRKHTFADQAKILFHFLGSWLFGHYHPEKQQFIINELVKFSLLDEQTVSLPGLTFVYDKQKRKLICQYQTAEKTSKTFFYIYGQPGEIRTFVKQIRRAYDLFKKYNAKFPIQKSS